ncbi:hypothetical protein LZ30DRAFT_711083 [Colletotrichum cereale]|nr:hypothetical protein LZ30DRAFT_711083 [Colletotrichum cereale]
MRECWWWWWWWWLKTVYVRNTGSATNPFLGRKDIDCWVVSKSGNNKRAKNLVLFVRGRGKGQGERLSARGLTRLAGRNGPMFPDVALLSSNHRDGMTLCWTPCLDRRGGRAGVGSFAARPGVRRRRKMDEEEKGVRRATRVIRAIRLTLLVSRYRWMAQPMTKPPLRPSSSSLVPYSWPLLLAVITGPGTVLGGRVAQPVQNHLCFTR